MKVNCKIFPLQERWIFPHLNVEESLTFAGMGLPKKELRIRKEEVTSYFDLFKDTGNGRLKMEASYLSGGEQHQLALAMVLMKKPKLLILDEPSAGLSPGSVKRHYNILQHIKDKLMISILLIKQNIQFASRYSNKMLLLKDGKIDKYVSDLEKVENEYFYKLIKRSIQ